MVAEVGVMRMRTWHEKGNQDLANSDPGTDEHRDTPTLGTAGFTEQDGRQIQRPTWPEASLANVFGPSNRRPSSCLPMKVPLLDTPPHSPGKAHYLH